MAFKMRGAPVIKGTVLHKHARSTAVKKAADDQLRQKIAQQNAQGSADPNTPLPLRGRLQDKINERLNRKVTIGTRVDDEGKEIVTKTVERDRLFGGGRTSRTRDKRNWDIENVAPENRARQIAQESTVDLSQEPIMVDKPDTRGDYTGPTQPIYDVKDPREDTRGGKGDFPIREGGGEFTNPVMPPSYRKVPIKELPPDMQDELVRDITDENVGDETLLQKYGSDILEGLGYVVSPIYGIVKEGAALSEQGPAEYFDRFGGVIGNIGGYLFGEPEQGTQASGSEQAGGGQGRTGGGRDFGPIIGDDDPMPDENDPKYKYKYNPGEMWPQVITKASDGKVFSTPAGVAEYEQFLADMEAWRRRNPGRSR